MKKTLTSVLLASAMACSVAVSPVLAQEAAAYRETQLGLYVTASEAYELMQANERAVLIDVRDPVEVKFTGFAEPTAIHVPWALADRDNFDEESQSWSMAKNSEFNGQVKAKLEALGVAEDDPVVVMCRSGARSAMAVDVITEMGYSEVYSVTDGFEGSKLEEGDSKGVRAVNGWRNSGLPWSYEVDPDVAWQPAE